MNIGKFFADNPQTVRQIEITGAINNLSLCLARIVLRFSRRRGQGLYLAGGPDHYQRGLDRGLLVRNPVAGEQKAFGTGVGRRRNGDIN